MGNVKRSEAEKAEIGAFTEKHGMRAAARHYGCDRLTAGRYQELYGGNASGMELVAKDDAEQEAIENENHKLRQENEWMYKKIVQLMRELERAEM